MIAPENARRLRRLVGKSLHLRKVAREVVHATHHPIDRLVRIKIHAGVERSGGVRDRHDRLHGNDAPDLNRRQVHDLDLARRITRRRARPAAVHFVDLLRRNGIDLAVLVGDSCLENVDPLPARMIAELKLGGILLALVGQHLPDIDVRRHPGIIGEDRRLARIEDVQHVRVMQAVTRENRLLPLRRLHALDLLAQARVGVGCELHRTQRERTVHSQFAVRTPERADIIVAVRRLLVLRQLQHLAERPAKVDRQLLMHLRRRIQLQRELALLQGRVPLQQPIGESQRL